MKGQPVYPEVNGPVYNHSAQTSYGYLGGLGDSLIIRDLNFELLQVYLLEGDIQSIEDVTPLPHNGCRPPKRRRV